MKRVETTAIKLTHFSHGSGCGCKIAPNVLERILSQSATQKPDSNLLVGNGSFDDAAVYQIDDKISIISTTDFFTPIVDDPYDFGAIAAVNALSDVYAMGGAPLMAISILGWPLDKLSEEMAGKVVSGAISICAAAGITLAGGHSIDSPEPIFGLAVTGQIETKNIKRNNTAIPGCELYLTKPLGVGIMTTAQKTGLLKAVDLKRVTETMKTLNRLGETLGQMEEVCAITDVTGFGFLGHVIEMCEGSGVSALIELDKLPLLPNLSNYIAKKTFPGGTFRNYKSYGHKADGVNPINKVILCDPQTSGGLLIAVKENKNDRVKKLLEKNKISPIPLGKIIKQEERVVLIR